MLFSFSFSFYRIYFMFWRTFEINYCILYFYDLSQIYTSPATYIHGTYIPRHEYSCIHPWHIHPWHIHPLHIHPTPHTSMAHTSHATYIPRHEYSCIHPWHEYCRIVFCILGNPPDNTLVHTRYIIP
jgi:hypothetical protein